MTSQWIYCESHLYIHRLNADGTCWCGVSKMEMDHDGAYKHPLDYMGESETYVHTECRQKGLKLHTDTEQNKF